MSELRVSRVDVLDWIEMQGTAYTILVSAEEQAQTSLHEVPQTLFFQRIQIGQCDMIKLTYTHESKSGEAKC